LRLHRAIAAAAVIVTAVACDSVSSATPATGAPQPRAAVPAMVVDTLTMDVPRVYPSQVYVERDVAVAARSAGVLDSLFVNLGSVVRAGASLAVVDSRGQVIEAARARERLARARNAMQRALELAKGGGVTGVESEQVAGDLQQAELTMQAAERALVLTRVTAPFAGVVTARYARPQQLVADGDTLFRVAESGPQLVRVRVAEAAARGVQRGDGAIVRATTGTVRVTASVVFTAPALDPASGTREVILQLAAPRFLLGESVTVEVGRERRLVVVAPGAAIAADGYALVIDAGRTTMRPVTVGATLPDGRVEIVTGLVAGERLAPPRR